MIKKIICMGMMLIMAFSFAACGKEKFATDAVRVGIRGEYHQKFDANEFTVEDFKWDNVEKIECNFWPSLGIGYITVYLKKHGKKRVSAAIKHFEALDFVAYAEKIGMDMHAD